MWSARVARSHPRQVVRFVFVVFVVVEDGPRRSLLARAVVNRRTTSPLAPLFPYFSGYTFTVQFLAQRNSLKLTRVRKFSFNYYADAAEVQPPPV